MLKQEKDTAKQTNHFHTQTLFHSPIHLLSFLCSLVFSLKNKSHLNQIWGTPHLVHIHFPVTIKLVIFLVALQPICVLIVVFVTVYLFGFGIFSSMREHIVAWVRRGEDLREVVVGERT